MIRCSQIEGFGNEIPNYMHSENHLVVAIGDKGPSSSMLFLLHHSP